MKNNPLKLALIREAFCTLQAEGNLNPSIWDVEKKLDKTYSSATLYVAMQQLRELGVIKRDPQANKDAFVKKMYPEKKVLVNNGGARIKKFLQEYKWTEKLTLAVIGKAVWLSWATVQYHTAKLQKKFWHLLRTRAQNKRLYPVQSSVQKPTELPHSPNRITICLEIWVSQNGIVNILSTKMG